MAHVSKRQTASGQWRYDVEWRLPDGKVRTRTFPRRKDADAYAVTIEADRLRGIVVDPRRARVTLTNYANDWLTQRTDLGIRTAELYRWVLDRHVLPVLGGINLAHLTPSAVRSWNAALAQELPGTAAKAYRLLSSIMRTAVADEVVSRNPCQVKGAAVERTIERPVASVAEVQALAAAMPAHLRIGVLLAAWCQLRRGELLGLRRCDVDLLHGTIFIQRTRTTSMTGAIIEKTPKTEAGRRRIAIPPNVMIDLEKHLSAYVGPEPDALLLVGEKGAPLRPHVLQIAWDRARQSVGRPDLRLHDLRHSGLTWSAATGATVAELMHRAGHASPAAALRYQHATEDRDRALAQALATLSPGAQVVQLESRNVRGMEPTERL
jgi:integrase